MLLSNNVKSSATLIPSYNVLPLRFFNECLTNHLSSAVPRTTLNGRDFFVWFPIRVTNLTSALSPIFYKFLISNSLPSLSPITIQFFCLRSCWYSSSFSFILSSRNIFRKLGRIFWPFITAAKLFGTFVIFSWKDSRSTVSQADWIFPRLVWLHLLYFVLLFLFGSATFWCHLSASLRFLAGPLLFTRLQLYAGTFPKISLFVCWTIAEIHPAL